MHRSLEHVLTCRGASCPSFSGTAAVFDPPRDCRDFDSTGSSWARLELAVAVAGHQAALALKSCTDSCGKGKASPNSLHLTVQGTSSFLRDPS